MSPRLEGEEPSMSGPKTLSKGTQSALLQNWSEVSHLTELTTPARLTSFTLTVLLMAFSRCWFNSFGMSCQAGIFPNQPSGFPAPKHWHRPRLINPAQPSASSAVADLRLSRFFLTSISAGSPLFSSTPPPLPLLRFDTHILPSILDRDLIFES